MLWNTLYVISLGKSEEIYIYAINLKTIFAKSNIEHINRWLDLITIFSE